jgi:hypothetical protein
MPFGNLSVPQRQAPPRTGAGTSPPLRNQNYSKYKGKQFCSPPAREIFALEVHRCSSLPRCAFMLDPASVFWDQACSTRAGFGFVSSLVCSSIEIMYNEPYSAQPAKRPPLPPLREGRRNKNCSKTKSEKFCFPRFARAGARAG